jgi:DNA repair exonuclease SbcCD nuclease subunit
LISLIREEKPDLVCILGDVLHYHERLITPCLNKACEFISRVRDECLTYVLVGNHDMISHVEFLSDKHWMNALKEWKNIVIVDTVKTLEIKGFNFIFCPYVYPGRFIEALETEKKDWKSVDCIFAHQEFEGCKMGAIISVEGDKWNTEYPSVISGHIHDNQTIKNVYYTGSALQHSFGENSKKIIAIIEFKKGEKEYNLREVNLDLPKKKIIAVDISDLPDFKIKKKNELDKIKISVNGCSEEFKTFKKSKKYKELVDKGIKIVFKQKRIENKKEESEADGDFISILSKKIKETKNFDLLQAYEFVVNNKNLEEDSLILI